MRVKVGTIRFVLALAVVVYHLTQQVPSVGQFAVYGFYVISGFLMTMVLNETYKFNFRKYVLTRALRLFPALYVLTVVALIAFWCVPEYGVFHPSWSQPPSGGAYVGNLFMFPWAFLSDEVVPALPWQVSGLYFRILPSTWSVGVELVCYFLLWLIGSRSIWGAIIMIAASATWCIYWSFTDQSLPMRYFPAPAAALGFGVGSLAYFAGLVAHRRFASVPLSALVILVLAAFFGNWQWSLRYHHAALETPHFYFNLAVFFFAAVAIGKRQFTGDLKKWDKRIGDLAYPMFLGHYVFSLIAWKLFLPAGSPMRGWEIFWYGGALTIIGSIATVLIADKPIEQRRDRIRGRKRDAEISAP